MPIFSNLKSKNQSFILHTPYFILAALALLTFSYQITRPLAYHHDWNGAHYGIFARNHLRYGLLETTGAQVRNIDQTTPDNFGYDFHHPNGYVLILATSFKLFGINELALRLPSVLASTISILLMYRLASRLFSPIPAFTAALFPIFTPMFRYFASLPAQEPLVLMLILLQLNLYYEWVRTTSVISNGMKWNKKSSEATTKQSLLSAFILHTPYFIPTLGFLAAFIGWPGLYLTPLLAIHAFIFLRSRSKMLILWFLIPILYLSFHMLHAYLLTGSPGGGGFGTAFLFRLTQSANDHQTFTTHQFIKHSLTWLSVYYTKTFFLMSFLGISFLVAVFLNLIQDLRKTKRFTITILLSRLPRNSQLIVITLIYGLIHPLIFRNAAFVHEYMWIYLTPFFTLTTAYFINSMHNYFSNSCHPELDSESAESATSNLKNFLTSITKFNYFKLPCNSIFLTFTSTLLILVAIFLERHTFTQTLFTSQHSILGVELGQYLAEHTDPGDKIYITNGEFHSFFNRFAMFYSDRNLYTGDLKNLQLTDFRYIITPTTHALPSQELTTYLNTTFTRTEIPNFILYSPT